MFKSYDNYIGIDDLPKDIYGRTLSVPDDLIYIYYELTTNVSNNELSKIKIELEDQSKNPRDLKRALARKLVEMYHSKEEALAAEEEFDNIFIKKGIPDDVPEIKIEDDSINILDLITKVNFAPTKSEARRLVMQGGVSISDKKITDFKADVSIEDGMILKVGKRKFIKINK